MKPILYTTHCPKCKVIENKLKAKNIEFVTVDAQDKLLELGITSVPVLKVDDKMLNFLEANKYVNSL